MKRNERVGSGRLRGLHGQYMGAFKGVVSHSPDCPSEIDVVCRAIRCLHQDSDNRGYIHEGMTPTYAQFHPVYGPAFEGYCGVEDAAEIGAVGLLAAVLKRYSRSGIEQFAQGARTAACVREFAEMTHMAQVLFHINDWRCLEQFLKMLSRPPLMVGDADADEFGRREPEAIPDILGRYLADPSSFSQYSWEFTSFYYHVPLDLLWQLLLVNTMPLFHEKLANHLALPGVVRYLVLVGLASNILKFLKGPSDSPDTTYGEVERPARVWHGARWMPDPFASKYDPHKGGDVLASKPHCARKAVEILVKMSRLSARMYLVVQEGMRRCASYLEEGAAFKMTSHMEGLKSVSFLADHLDELMLVMTAGPPVPFKKPHQQCLACLAKLNESKVECKCGWVAFCSNDCRDACKKSLAHAEFCANVNPARGSRLPTKKCRACGDIAELRCSRCKAVHYCTKEHQRSDWVKHKPKCIPQEDSGSGSGSGGLGGTASGANVISILPRDAWIHIVSEFCTLEMVLSLRETCRFLREVSLEVPHFSGFHARCWDVVSFGWLGLHTALNRAVVTSAQLLRDEGDYSVDCQALVTAIKMLPPSVKRIDGERISLRTVTDVRTVFQHHGSALEGRTFSKITVKLRADEKFGFAPVTTRQGLHNFFEILLAGGHIRQLCLGSCGFKLSEDFLVAFLAHVTKSLTYLIVARSATENEKAEHREEEEPDVVADWKERLAKGAPWLRVWLA